MSPDQIKAKVLTFGLLLILFLIVTSIIAVVETSPAG